MAKYSKQREMLYREGLGRAVTCCYVLFPKQQLRSIRYEDIIFRESPGRAELAGLALGLLGPVYLITDNCGSKANLLRSYEARRQQMDGQVGRRLESNIESIEGIVKYRIQKTVGRRRDGKCEV